MAGAGRILHNIVVSPRAANFFPHNVSWQAVPRVVVIGYGELLTSELLPAFVVAKMARCLKLNV